MVLTPSTGVYFRNLNNLSSKMNYSLVTVLLTMCVVEAAEDSTEVNMVEPRGHGKYALLTHLAFLLAAKAGLYKIVLGIVLVIASMKAMVVMAWALAIFKYAPDVWPTYKHADFNYHGYDKYHNSIHERPIHFFYVMVTKLVILKIVYGIIFFVLLSKGWHFVLWFIHYLKEKKREHEYVEFDHDYGHHDFGHHDFGHYDYGHHIDGHHDYGHHGHYNHEPYRDSGYGSYDKDEYYPQKKKGVYDSDGSYSVRQTR